ncbi:MBL fold metallo-hydrolase [Streptomyces olivoreticuli]
MRVTMLGHAGLYLETNGGSILCDPWSSPAYFASWFPFPDNRSLAWERYARPDYLYISHLHQDHFDPAHLREHVSHDVTVLLPDFPLPDLREALSGLGYTRFRLLSNGKAVELGGLRVAITTVSAPVDGPIGDSALAVDDGTARILDQNDARPVHPEPITAFGPYDAHFLQFSGASWWPLTYDLTPRAKAVFGRAARANGMARAVRFIEQIGARHVVPCAGPACFLDDELFAYNDIEHDACNPFPDQSVFVDHLVQGGRPKALLTVPGTVLELADGDCTLRHPGPAEEALSPFTDKAAYLRSYADRARPLIERERRSWAVDATIDILAELKAWFEPLLQLADRICAGVGGPVLLHIGDLPLVIDFPAREVRGWTGEPCRFRFRFERALVERLIADHQVDWVNSLLLGLRFTAARVGPYNEYLYTFFKCLSPERISYADAWYAPPEEPVEFIRMGNWEVQRHCPHLQADLARFGEIEDGVLRCRMHNWRFELATGRCLNAEGNPLTARPIH